MKTRSIVVAALAVIASIWLTTAVVAFSGANNGSFETGTFSTAPFDVLGIGNTNLAGWTIESGSVDWVGSYWQAADGSRSIDLSGDEAGAISQTLATTVGNTYVVTFSMSGNPAGGPAAKTLTVGASGADPASYTFNTALAGNTFADMKWETKEYSFVATSSTSVLTFTSTTTGAIGPALDNVGITEFVPPSPSVPPSVPPSPSVPPRPSIEPSLAKCKDGGWLTILDAHGNAFKNQGDCVSYLATDGKNAADHR